MTNTKRLVSGSLSQAFAALLSLAMATGVYAAVDVPAPAQQLDELEQIWVTGKHLSEAIEDAEDDFFELYNKLNKDSDYDVFCGRMALNSGSMLMVRKCVPGFVVYNSYDPYSNSVRLGSSYGSCSGVTSYADSTGDAYYMSGCSGSYSSFGSGYGSYYPPSSQTSSGLMLMDRRPAYLKNVVQVVSSDSRLLEKTKGLAVLYNEMDAAQQRYVKLKNASRIDRVPWKSPKPNRGPRAL